MFLGEHVSRLSRRIIRYTRHTMQQRFREENSNIFFNELIAAYCSEIRSSLHFLKSIYKLDAPKCISKQRLDSS